MMKIEFFDTGGRSAGTIDASRVLIRDAHGNPVAFAVQYLNEGVSCVLAATADDPRFAQLLATIGVEASVIRNHLDLDDSE